jgi:signal transduction histidine kinase
MKPNRNPKNKTGRTPPSVQLSFRQEQRQKAPLPVRAACVLGMLGFSAYVIPDYFLVGSAIAPLLGARAFIVGGNLLVFFTTFTRFGEKHIHAMAVLSCLIMGLGVIALTLMTGGADSRYHEALLLVFMGFALLIPWSPWVAGVTFTTITAVYDVALVIWNMTDPTAAWIVNNFILWAGVVIATTGVAVTDRLRRIEHKARGQISAANEELGAALDRLKELDRHKTRLFANVSHELRTPLMMIMGPLEAMRKGRLKSNDARNLQSMAANAKRLLRQVNMLLEVARMETGRLRLDLAKGRPGEILATLVDAARPHAQARSITLQAKGLDTLPEVRFDREKIEVAAANLLSNALKFTPAGGRVEVCGTATEERIIVSVRDSGPGISAAQQEKIFDRFYQVDGSSLRANEGTGLGLSLAKELLKIHQGTIAVESELGKGAVFTLQWPRRPHEPADERRQRYRRKEDRLAAMRLESLTAHELEHRRVHSTLLADVQSPTWADSPAQDKPCLAAGSKGLSSPPGHGIRILFVEDNADLRAFVSRSLAPHYRVDTASDGKQALKHVLQQKPDIVLTDIMMPEMDGYTLCRRLKNDRATAKIPVVLLTAKTGTEAVVEGFDAGADDYVTKPFDIEELEARIAAHLRTRRLQATVAERESRLAAIGQMTASIVHDLRGPLTSILGYGDLLKQLSKDDSPLPEARQYLDEMTEQAERIRRMLQDILDYTRTGALTLNRTPTAMQKYLQKVVTSAVPRQNGAGFALQLDIDRVAETTLLLDQSRIQRVLENLLTNAREALARASTKKPTIRLSADTTADRVVIRIEDNGPGLATDEVETVFHPFASGHHKKSTGLGLATVRNIIRAHGGTVSAFAHGTLGGAAFEITLPRPAAPQNPNSAQDFAPP